MLQESEMVRGAEKCIPCTSLSVVESTYTITISYMNVVKKQAAKLLNKSSELQMHFSN